MLKQKNSEKDARRNFLKLSALGTAAMACGGILNGCKTGSEENQDSTDKVKLLSPEGELVEVDKQHLTPAVKKVFVSGKDAKAGIPGRKFVMVIDLSKCKNARKCIEKCQEGHDLAPDQEWIKVQLMKDNEESVPYWFPKPCFHCDNPPCVKVCPVDATYKRQDGIVLVDNERCIGCKFCISACPYSTRIFNWEDLPQYQDDSTPYSPETGVPGQVGTIGKCDFCPDLSREGILPHCVRGCPMGAIYFGDANEDAVSNGTETLRFRKLLADKIGYRYLEELGTKPRVYYLPPVDRMFPYERGLDILSEEEKEMYKDIL
jgi:molybdopterin-containing oxidoreductase family iron-sulfur binding subunit